MLGPHTAVSVLTANCAKGGKAQCALIQRLVGVRRRSSVLHEGETLPLRPYNVHVSGCPLMINDLFHIKAAANRLQTKYMIPPPITGPDCVLPVGVCFRTPSPRGWTVVSYTSPAVCTVSMMRETKPTDLLSETTTEKSHDWLHVSDETVMMSS